MTSCFVFDRARPGEHRTKQSDQHQQAGREGADRVVPQVRTNARFGLGSAAALLHCTGARSPSRAQAQAGKPQARRVSTLLV